MSFAQTKAFLLMQMSSTCDVGSTICSLIHSQMLCINYIFGYYFFKCVERYGGEFPTEIVNKLKIIYCLKGLCNFVGLIVVFFTSWNFTTQGRQLLQNRSTHICYCKFWENSWIESAFPYAFWNILDHIITPSNSPFMGWSQNSHNSQPRKSHTTFTHTKMRTEKKHHDK